MRHWKDAKTVADLGQLMADWLEGRIHETPNACGELDPETTPLVRTLAAINRGGYLTECSQPGSDDRHGVQVPFVSGFIAHSNRRLVKALQREIRDADLCIIIDGKRDDRRPGGVPVAFKGREVVANAGKRTPRWHLTDSWSELNSTALANLLGAYEVTVIDPDGATGTRMWEIVTRTTAQYGGR